MPTCASCSKQIAEGEEVAVRASGRKNATVVLLCPDCASAAEEAFKSETEGPNMSGAFLLGLAATAASAAAWFGVVVATRYQIGLIAIGVGWLVARAVMLGAGRKRGPSLQVLSVALTLIAMVCAEYLIALRYFSVPVLAAGTAGHSLWQPFATMAAIVAGAVRNDPLILAFWGFAIFEAATLPAARRLRRV
ncbi:MAG: hypothetical protein ACM3ZC_10250 [Bacteroidota bacterium]